MPPHKHASKTEKLRPEWRDKPHLETLYSKQQNLQALVASILIGSIIALVIGYGMHLVSLSIGVILSVLAPIWVGSITIALSFLRKEER